MAPRYLLYLTVEGVVVPSNMPRSRLSSAGSRCWRESRHLNDLADMVGPMEELDIVLNSDWLPELGMRTVMNILPRSLHSRIVGTTVPGNRIIRRCRLSAEPGRRARLDADVCRRQPLEITVLECDARCVPIPLRDDAVVVPAGLWGATRDDWQRLNDRLKRHASP
jgi:hypothetical protein